MADNRKNPDDNSEYYDDTEKLQESVQSTTELENNKSEFEKVESKYYEFEDYLKNEFWKIDDPKSANEKLNKIYDEARKCFDTLYETLNDSSSENELRKIESLGNKLDKLIKSIPDIKRSIENDVQKFRDLKSNQDYNNKGTSGDESNKVRSVDDSTIELARSADLENYCRQKGYELEREGNQYRVKGHSGLLINGKMWYSHSLSRGGNAIDFLMRFEGKSFKEAIHELTGKSNTTMKYQPKITEKESFKDIILPVFSRDMKRTFSYLIITRGINTAVLQDMVGQKKIGESLDYRIKEEVAQKLIDDNVVARDKLKDQSTIKSLIDNGTIKEYSVMHNVCFLGRDKEGKIQYGMERSTFSNSSFKRELSGSNKAYNFCIEGKSDRLIVCESAIEVLSVASIERKFDKNYKKDHKLSCGGVADKALEQYLKDHPEIKKVVIAFNKDQDPKAIKNVEIAIQNIKDKYGSSYEIDRIEPYIGKDWNDVLKSISKNKIDKGSPPDYLKELLGDFKMMNYIDKKKDIPAAPRINM